MKNKESILHKIFQHIADFLDKKSVIPQPSSQETDMRPRPKSETRSEVAVAVKSEPIPTQLKWHPPIREDKFRPTQKFLNPDPLYKITGHHPGTDYGTQGEDNVPLHFCADGEVVESGLHKAFGNYFFYYIPVVDRTFVYFHLRDAAPTRGQYKAGQQCGITGETGMSEGIHLHLECMKGRKTSSDRARIYTSKDALADAAEDADTFIRSRIILS